MSSDPNYNSKEVWNEIWTRESVETWRTYPELFDRIVALVPPGSKVLDVGGGIGILADRLRDEKNCSVMVLDHSVVALQEASRKGHSTAFIDLESMQYTLPPGYDGIIATEVLEHLTGPALMYFLGTAKVNPFHWGMFTVPNFCLGPDEEPQHHHKFTAGSIEPAMVEGRRLVLSFPEYLAYYFPHYRVECLSRYLLGVASQPGQLADKGYKLSMTLPVKDEEEDIERVLKSFRGVADEIVVGIDSQSSDKTVDIVQRYADRTFHFVWRDPEEWNKLYPEGDPEHDNCGFSYARNVCIERCTGDWIFMTEGHEHLQPESIDPLLTFGQTALVENPQLKVVLVRRESKTNQWYFPWLFRNDPKIRFKRPIHNVLNYPEGYATGEAPQIATYHARGQLNAFKRSKQRLHLNARDMLSKILDANKRHEVDPRSMFYLANEFRGRALDAFRSKGKDKTKRINMFLERAIEWYNRYLDFTKPENRGAERYQARLNLSECLVHFKRFKDAWLVLSVAQQDDWQRIEHFIWLGDLFRLGMGQTEKGAEFYRFAAVRIGKPPVSGMWIDKAAYSYLPATKLATALTELLKFQEALSWAERVVELIPKDEPELLENALENWKLLKSWVDLYGPYGERFVPEVVAVSQP